jgi:hypothetical protein
LIAPAFVSRSRNDQIVFASGTRSESPRPRKRPGRQPVVDQKLRPVVGEVVLGLGDEDLEHHHRIERRPPALRPIAIAERRGQVRAEHLEIHHRREGLELVADVAQPTQQLFHVEQSGLPLDVPIPVPKQG